MNSFRSPAPPTPNFNLGSRNNVFNKAINVATNVANTAMNTAMNTAANAANTAMNTATNIFSPVANNAPSMANRVSKIFSSSYILLVAIVVIMIVVVSIFWRQIGDGASILYNKVRDGLGAKSTVLPSTVPEEQNVTATPEAPQDNTVDERKFVEKILPGRAQVFNINKNAYTYHDAEPLCKALGAELATYEQVKEAYSKGADWCNYGWTKGQMATFPTQSDTWEQLQQGPEDQRDACGRPGVNGGFFDNPELRFGVNCYGIKPDQKDHDVTAVTSGEAAPLSPGGLEFEKKLSKYRGEVSSIAILPFNRSNWST